MSKWAISLERVTKVHSGGWRKSPVPAIVDVDLEIGFGESVGFIGHNGAGKSTSIRIALGLQSPSSGTARLKGGDPRDSANRVGVSYLPENPLMYDYLRPIELLRMACRLNGLAAHDVDPRCDAWLDRFGLAGIGGKRIGQLSKGMTQRTALAMALVTDPEVLVLDEPLSGLDPLGRREVVEILSEYRSKGGTLWFSSHVLTDVDQLADRFAFIHRGRIRVVGRPESLLNEAESGYELVVASGQSLPGFDSIGIGRARRVVRADELAALVSCLSADGVRLISIRDTNTLEQAYLNFVRSQESVSGGHR